LADCIINIAEFEFSIGTTILSKLSWQGFVVTWWILERYDIS